MARAIVLDTETTGLTLHPDAPPHMQPRCIEFGAALIDCSTCTVLETADILINPGVALPPDIVRITGLTDEALQDAWSFEQAEPSIRRLFKGADVVIAHNLPFDKAILLSELRQLPHPVDHFPWPRYELCTVAAFREMWGRNPKLIEVYEFFVGQPLDQKHRALSDVEALVEVVRVSGLLQTLEICS